jgi:hypothetical protein
MNYALVLSTFYDGKQWVMTGNEYAGLRWLDESTKPTDEELTAQYASAQAKEAAAKEIAELKGKLIATDYVALSDYDKSKPEVIAERQQWRARIRELEQV